MRESSSKNRTHLVKNLRRPKKGGKSSYKNRTHLRKAKIPIWGELTEGGNRRRRLMNMNQSNFPYPKLPESPIQQPNASLHRFSNRNIHSLCRILCNFWHMGRWHLIFQTKPVSESGRRGPGEDVSGELGRRGGEEELHQWPEN